MLLHELEEPRISDAQGVAHLDRLLARVQNAARPARANMNRDDDDIVREHAAGTDPLRCPELHRLMAIILQLRVKELSCVQR